MARPLPAAGPLRGGHNGAANGRAPASGLLQQAAEDDLAAPATLTPEEAQELERLRDENGQLRALCLELEQALHQATQHASTADGDRLREYEALLDEKTEIIRQLHEQVQQLQAASQAEPTPEAGAEAQPAKPAHTGPAPREEELLSLSEELERERRQLQEDEQTLMNQMREMECSMARERAEMARQRNEMQRLHSDIQHEIERLEKCGALQSKIEGLKSKLQDAVVRRGSAPGQSGMAPSHSIAAGPAPAVPSKKEGLLGRFFGGK